MLIVMITPDPRAAAIRIAVPASRMRRIFLLARYPLVSLGLCAVDVGAGYPDCGGARRERREYFEDYYERDERVPRFRALPDSRLVHVSDLFTDEEKKTSSVYNEALPLAEMQSCVSVRLDGPNGSRIVWTLGDPTAGDGWSFEQTEMIERVLPHLRQYVRVRQVLADADGLRCSLATLLDNTATGVIQLDRRGRIVAVQDRAREMVKAAGGLFDQGGFLRARASSDDDHLQGLVARALPPFSGRGASGSMVVRRPLGLSRLVVHVIPVGFRDADVLPSQVAALVLVVDPSGDVQLDPALVAAALGLSPAQNRVAVMLAEGNTVREIARAIGRSENTIRWHIRQIFEKHGLTRLVQLVQLVRSLAGPSSRTPGA